MRLNTRISCFCSVLLFLTIKAVLSNELPKATPLVTGGKDIEIGTHKHLVLLVSTPAMCSGSIIASRWIVTAAHCYTNDYLQIYHKYNLGPSHGYGKKIAEGENWFAHPHFRFPFGQMITSEMSSKDIGLVKTRQHISFDCYVQPVRLAVSDPFVGALGVVAGYGQNEDPNQLSPKEGQVEITACVDGTVGILCTNGAAFPKPGDSGGPLVVEDRLVGVVSAGCDDCPEDIYASVATHFRWIMMIVKRY